MASLDHNGIMCDSDENPTSRARARDLVLELISMTSNEYNDSLPTIVTEDLQTRGTQRKICAELLDNLRTAREMMTPMTAEKRSTSCTEESFIRTTMSEYNNKEYSTPNNADPTCLKPVNIREALGGLPASNISQLAIVLTQLISHRVNIEYLLPGTQDTFAIMEAPGLMIDSVDDEGSLTVNKSRRESGDDRTAKAAMTISPLGLTAAQLYVELIGMKGAWGAGIIDVGGISAVSALMRRWCVECRGREPKENSTDKTAKGGRKRNDGFLAKKKAKSSMAASRKSARINAEVSITGDDVESLATDFLDSPTSMPCVNPTFFVEDDNSLENYEKMSDHAMIIGGLKLAQSLGNAPLQIDYKNWSAEARESFLDAVCTSLGTASALLEGCKTRSGDAETASNCQAAIVTLERALCRSVLPSKIDRAGGSPDAVVVAPSKSRSRSKHGTKSPKEELAEMKLLHDTTIYFLRGLMPILNMKMELPNGQLGKISAYQKATALLVRIVSCVCEDIRLSPEYQRNHHLILSNGVTDTQTPRRDGRKSISLSHTPARCATESKSNTLSSIEILQPPSLKKSITPRLTRSAANLALNERSTIHPVLNLVMGMLHKIFTSKGLERAESRARATNLGIACLARFPFFEKRRMLTFVKGMCQSKVSSHRLLGVELIGGILCNEWYWIEFARENKSNGVITPYNTFDERTPETNSSSFNLLLTLQERLTDKSPTVRTRAAMSLSEVVRKANTIRGNAIDFVVDFENLPNPNEPLVLGTLINELCTVGSSLVDSLRKRASTDDKATVRKAAIIAWLQMLSLAHSASNAEFAISELDISALRLLCNDSSVATRIAAADALTKLLQAFHDCEEYTTQASALEIAWAHSVLPLVEDVEVSCSSKAVEFFSSVIVEPIVELGRNADDISKASDPRYLFVWRILSKISIESQDSGGSTNVSLQTAIQKLLINSGSDSKDLAKNLFRAVYCVGANSLGLNIHSSLDFPLPQLEEDLCGLTAFATRAGSWCLLNALTSCFINSDGNKISASKLSLSNAFRASAVDASFITLSLKKIRLLLNSSDCSQSKKLSLVVTARDCLEVMAKMGSYVPIEDAKSCLPDLLYDLKSFSMSIDLIPASVSALIALIKRTCDESAMNVFDECEKSVNQLLKCCENEMETSFAKISNRTDANEEEEKLSRILFLVGELCMVGFTSNDEVTTTGAHRDLSTEREPVRGLIIRPSLQLAHLIKLMLPNCMPIPGSDDLMPTPSRIRAHAFISLGKLCLRDERLAKECLKILARELDHNSTSNPSVQSNALMVMGDLCVRYTNLVDKYLPFMAACLQAGEAKRSETGSSSRLSITLNGSTGRYSLVKKNAVLLLSSLVLQDYLKWRGLFVFRFLAAIADEDNEVSCLAQSAIFGPLLEKQPNLIASSFVESVFVFNSCKAHPIYAAAAVSGCAGSVEVDFEGGLLEGGDGYCKRHEVYQMMLTNMSDEQKLKVNIELVKRIIGGALETNGDLGIVCRLAPQACAKISSSRVDSSTHVLRDTFAILSSPNMKVGRKSSEEAEIEDELVGGFHDTTDQRIFNKERLLSKISRKHLMEIVIPVLCNLKIILEGSQSPLLKDLMQYLGYIFRSFKRDVLDHLADDPTLLQELEYDTRQFEKKQRQSSILRRS